MPGKVNPTQVESLTMVCTRVFGNNATITFAASQGHLELNVLKPVVGFALLESTILLADGIDSFVTRCVDGIEADEANIKRFLDRSLMLVTALAPKIGYDAASKIARAAHQQRHEPEGRGAGVRQGDGSRIRRDRAAGEDARAERVSKLPVVMAGLEPASTQGMRGLLAVDGRDSAAMTRKACV